LLISVPQPQPRGGGAIYDPLVEAEAETREIVKTLTALGGAVNLDLLKGPDATRDAVMEKIRTGHYHIVHFNGHAVFKSDRPERSALVLFDEDLTTAAIFAYFRRHPPVLFVMNGCETAATGASTSDWKDRYDILGLARVFLETGAYLVGNRWKVGDKGAAAFAQAFYSGLVQGLPLGRAVRDARIACRAATPADDFSWASYLYYGDPRLCFRKC
jgi:CHAT domain-containing protein